jgi:hypothetical protein
MMAVAWQFSLLIKECACMLAAGGGAVRYIRRLYWRQAHDNNGEGATAPVAD